MKGQLVNGDTYRGVPFTSFLQLDLSGELLLPNFQRDFVWNREEQENLLSSFFVDIPIGSVLILNGEAGRFASRRLTYNEEATPTVTECKYVLDGQQRMSTLKTAFFDVFGKHEDWRSTWERLYAPLRNRWFINVLQSAERDDDVFGMAGMRFRPEVFRAIEPGDIAIRLHHERVYKTTYLDQWHHPEHLLQLEADEIEKGHGEGHEYLAANQLAKEIAAQGLVPLYSLTSDQSQPLHKLVLRHIAQARQERLRDEVEAGERDIQKVLSEVSPDIQSLVASGDEDAVEQAWMSLRTEWTNSVNTFLEQVPRNAIARIELSTDELNRAIAIFENTNRGGTPLDVYDLVVARAAIELPSTESLTQKIVSYLSEPVELPSSLISVSRRPDTWTPTAMNVVVDDIPSSFTKDAFLNLLSLVCSAAKDGLDELQVANIKKKAILDLTSEEINGHTREALKGLVRGLAFLQFRCGHVEANDLTYRLMLLPISVSLLDDDVWEDKALLNKIEYWFWTALFSGRFRESQNSRCIEEISHLRSWLTGGGGEAIRSRDSRVLDEHSYSSLDVLLLKQPDVYPVQRAVRQGIEQYVLSNEPTDLLLEEDFTQVRIAPWKVAKGDTFHDRSGNEHRFVLESHHIIPLATATSIRESSQELRKKGDFILNSPLNLTPITMTANRILRDYSPDEYLNLLSDYSIIGHAIPNVNQIGPRDEESDQDYYERVLTERYALLKRDMKQELLHLVE